MQSAATTSSNVRLVKGIVLLAFAGYVLRSLLNPSLYVLLDYANLAMHEGGHVIFSPFGEVMTILGGSLMQVLMPIGIAVESEFRRKERFGAGMVLLWAAESMANVSVYIADASARDLPLLTDDPDSHDWWQLLGRWNMLAKDHQIAGYVTTAAWVVFFVGIVLALADIVD
jgi:hypothetical protein